MATRPQTDPSRDRRFFLDSAAPASEPRLAAQELHHALHVNRLGEGDRLWGLDGAGGAHLLEVTAASKRSLSLRPLGETRTAQPAGQPGAALIHLEVGLSLPKPGKAEDMVDRLTQLGVARVQLLTFHHSADHARKVSTGRMEKLQRASREAMKQCLRLWPLEIAAPMALEPWLDSKTPTVLMDPGATLGLPAWLQSLDSTEKLRLLIGPEGGFKAAEIQTAQDYGIQSAVLQGHVLRIETAAELAAGLALQLTVPPH